MLTEAEKAMTDKEFHIYAKQKHGMTLEEATADYEQHCKNQVGVHLAHCYQGEEDPYNCKYGDEDCPAKKPKMLLSPILYKAINDQLDGLAGLLGSFQKDTGALYWNHIIDELKNVQEMINHNIDVV